MNHEVFTVVSVVAATLRTVAEWSDQMARRELLNVASQVELDFDGTCCPLCEEVRCDESCPLQSIREGLNL